MRIRMTEKLRPFSHKPGASSLLPGSSWQFEVFPALIRIYNLRTAQPHLVTEININIVGPVKDFTFLLDLEKKCLCVWGESQKGYFRYYLRILAPGSYLGIDVEKIPSEGLHFIPSPPYHSYCFSNGLLVTHEKACYSPQQLVIACRGTEAHISDSIIIEKKELPSQNAVKEMVGIKSQEIGYPWLNVEFSISEIEKLSLGCHKAQDWEMISRRLDLKEIFPFCLRLASLIKEESEQKLTELSVGTLKLLQNCKELIDKRDITSLYTAFLSLFQAGFHHLLVPRLYDNDHQGFQLSQPTIENSISPLILLNQTAQLIRSLFIQENALGREIFILPVLLPEFPSGRFVNIKGLGLLMDLEWSKKSIRRMVIKALESKAITLHFQKHIKQCRLRKKDKKNYSSERRAEAMGVSIDEKGMVLEVEKGEVYFIDQFCK